MRAAQPAGLAGRRFTGRVLAGVRSAPYLRKWLILGTLIGVVAGLGAVVFYDGLRWASTLLLTDIGGYRPASTAGEGGFHLASGFSRPWAIPLVTAGGALLAGLLVFGLAPEAEGHGTDAAIKAVHSNPKGVRPRVILVKLIASMLTIGSGGSGGREGPTAQISSGFGSVLARALNLTPADARICVSAGIASGIGAIFRAPFGGALLGVELLYTNDVEIEALIPSLVATVVGYAVFCAIIGSFTPIFGDHSGASVGHAWELALFVVVGVVCGAVGKLYSGGFYRITDRFNSLKLPRAAKPAIAGLIVGALGLAIPGVLGTGYGEVQVLLDPAHLLAAPLWIIVLIPFAKIAATSLSIGSGGSGGIFGPGMVIGGATGAALWRLGHLAGLGSHDQVAFVIVGMAACFGAIAHAPIAVLLMVAEMTGSLALLPPAMVAIALAAFVVGDTTIYRSQLARRTDSAAHRFDLGVPQPGAIALRGVMSPPRLIIPARTSGADALDMLQQAGLPGAPVVNGDGAFIGSLQTHLLAEQITDRSDLMVGRLADAEAMTLPVDAGFDSAIEALPASKGGWVPVLDDHMRVVGIIAGSDLASGWQQTMRHAMSRFTTAAARTATIEGTITDGSAAAGRTINAVGLPRGAIVVSLVRHGNLITPSPQQTLEPGDTITVLAQPIHSETIQQLLQLTTQAATTADHGRGPV